MGAGEPYSPITRQGEAIQTVCQFSLTILQLLSDWQGQENLRAKLRDFLLRKPEASQQGEGTLYW